MNSKNNKEPPSLFDDVSLFADSQKTSENPVDTHNGLTGAGPLTELLDSNFMQYATYVIGSRAIPAVEDSLKPVQRRILHARRATGDARTMTNLRRPTMFQFTPVVRRAT